jgi:hypothetical protein
MVDVKKMVIKNKMKPITRAITSILLVVVLSFTTESSQQQEGNVSK